jgi:hypothetical protein
VLILASETLGAFACGKGLLPLSAAILDRIGVDDPIIQGILRHSTVSVTQNTTSKRRAQTRLQQCGNCRMRYCAPTEVPKTLQAVN